MKQTKLGISVGLVGAAVYFMCLFSGYFVAVLLAGYILLCEENAWLKRAAVKAVSLLVIFSLFVSVINLIPNAIGLINNIAVIFNSSFSVAVLSRIVTVIVNILDILEKVLFILLGIKALNQGTISVPVVDTFINKYMG